jgi:hypothetical protein
MIPHHIKYLIVPPHCQYTVDQLLPKFYGFILCSDPAYRISVRLAHSKTGKAMVWYIENGELDSFDDIDRGRYARDTDSAPHTMHIDQLFKPPTFKRRHYVQ